MLNTLKMNPYKVEDSYLYIKVKCMTVNSTTKGNTKKATTTVIVVSLFRMTTVMSSNVNPTRIFGQARIFSLTVILVGTSSRCCWSGQNSGWQGETSVSHCNFSQIFRWTSVGRWAGTPKSCNVLLINKSYCIFCSIIYFMSASLLK